MVRALGPKERFPGNFGESKKRKLKLNIGQRSLTPKVFYRVLLLSLALLAVVMLGSIFSSNNYLLGYATTEIGPREERSENLFVVACPLTYKNEACIRGTNVSVRFKPLFRIFNIRDNVLVSTSISFGNQLVCNYETLTGHRYRLIGKVLSRGTCTTVKNGFLCEANLT